MPPTSATTRVSPIREDQELVSDPHLRGLIDQVVLELKNSFATVAESRSTEDTRTDDIFRKLLASRRERTRARYQEHSRVLLRSVPAQLEQIRAIRLDTAAIVRNLGKPRIPTPPRRPQDPDLTAGLVFTKMRLYIAEVRCDEETDEWGNDEIALGGVYVDPYGKNSKDVHQMMLGKFETGTAKSYG